MQATKSRQVVRATMRYYGELAMRALFAQNPRALSRSIRRSLGRRYATMAFKNDPNPVAQFVREQTMKELEGDNESTDGPKETVLEVP